MIKRNGFSLLFRRQVLSRKVTAMIPVVTWIIIGLRLKCCSSGDDRNFFASRQIGFSSCGRLLCFEESASVTALPASNTPLMRTTVEAVDATYTWMLLLRMR